MSFLVSLLLPIIAAALYIRGCVERARLGKLPPHIGAVAALGGGALSGAAALVFLGVLGVIVLAVRGRPITPPEVEVPALVFWGAQFLIAAAIGGVVGALTSLALLPWARARAAHITPTPRP